MRSPLSLLLLWCACAVTFGVVSGDVLRSSAPVVVQALNPTGLRISVTDTSGVSVVIINANINIPIAQRETGQISGTVLETRNGHWTLEAKDVTLRPGDVVFYWIYMAIGSISDRREGYKTIYELLDPSCGPSPTTYNGRTACAGQLLLEENFETFNTSLWKHNIQFSDDPDLDFAIYTDDIQNSFVKNGKLHIRASVLAEDELLEPTTLEKCTWDRGGEKFCERKPIGWDILPPTRSAMVTTRDNFSFKFGRIEIRAKTAAGDWLLSKLLLEPEAGVYGRGDAESGKLLLSLIMGNADLTETRGQQVGASLSTLQAEVKTCHRKLAMLNFCRVYGGRLYSDEMHLYSLIWTPNSIIMRLDDCAYEVKPPHGSFLKHDYFKDNCHDSPWEKGTHLVPFDQEFYVTFGLAPGGLGLYDDKVTSNGLPKPWSDQDPRAPLNFWKLRHLWRPTWKSDFEVDYVKIWAL